ncbi:helix-turn-helix domain-containing protein [Nocardia farcinica]|uniref:helix-turn-helix domain-containing protein n=1 Tax=Nocardia farcinica TaxID=37329 RepID=UPI001B3C83AD|nr:helix-turn-helix transcriptional regulator [Nocardia farcinica]MBF6536869.1 helix-turn-helix transcriptional regulator [Nocardia farcinica]
MSKLNWSEERARRIGLEVKAQRGKRSGQWLADETATHGHPVSRTTISEIENGKRRDITLAEITVLARALAVSPLQLIYPDLAHGPVEVLPGMPVSSAEAMRWFAGEDVLRADNSVFDRTATRPMTWTRMLYRYALDLRGSMNFALSIRDAPNSTPAHFDQAARRVESDLHMLEEWIELMREAGLPVDGDDIRALALQARRVWEDAEG